MTVTNGYPQGKSLASGSTTSQPVVPVGANIADAGFLPVMGKVNSVTGAMELFADGQPISLGGGEDPRIGDLMTLQTEDKGSVVDAINSSLTAPVVVRLPVTQNMPFTKGSMLQITERGVCNAQTAMRLDALTLSTEMGVGMIETSMVPIGNRFLVAYTDQYRHGELSVGFVAPSKTGIVSGERQIVAIRGEGDGEPIAISLVKVSDTLAYLFYLCPSDRRACYHKLTIAGEGITVSVFDLAPNNSPATQLFVLFLGNNLFAIFTDNTAGGPLRVVTINILEDNTSVMHSMHMFGDGAGTFVAVTTHPETLKPLAVYLGAETTSLCAVFFSLTPDGSDLGMGNQQFLDFSSHFRPGETIANCVVQPVDATKYIFAFSFYSDSPRQAWVILDNFIDDAWQEFTELSDTFSACKGPVVFARCTVDTGYFFYSGHTSGRYYTTKYRINSDQGCRLLTSYNFTETMSENLAGAVFPNDKNCLFVAFRELEIDKYLQYKVLGYSEVPPTNVIGMAMTENEGDFATVCCGPVITARDLRLTPGKAYYITEWGKLTPTTSAPYVGVALSENALLFAAKSL